MPGRAHHGGSEDGPGRERPLDRHVARAPHAQREPPFGERVLLRLHGAEPGDDVLGTGQAAGGQALTMQACPGDLHIMSAMKVATWNVNGIRARATQAQEWLERERPDVVCLQELKAELAQVPEVVQREDYHAFWHCCKGYSGVSLQLRKETFPDPPVYRHPSFDLESRVVTAELGELVIASIYVPNGGKDYPAKITFLTRLIEWARELRSAGRE